MNDRRDRCEEERKAYECLYAAGLLEFREYQRVKARWQSRWRDSATLLDAIPSHAPDCGCSECEFKEAELEGRIAGAIDIAMAPVMCGSCLELPSETGSSLSLHGDEWLCPRCYHAKTGEYEPSVLSGAPGYSGEGPRWTVELKPLALTEDRTPEQLAADGDGPKLYGDGYDYTCGICGNSYERCDCAQTGRR